MDAMDILGGLLGGKSGSGGIGGKILKEILTGGRAPSSSGQRAPSQPAPSQRAPGNQGRNPMDLDMNSSELEDLLNVATGKASRPPQKSAPPASPFPSPRSAPPPAQAGNRIQFPNPTPKPPSQIPEERQNELAILMIRAMIQASKADGDVSQEEQERLFAQVGDSSQEAVQFLRDEFSKSFDIREFCWSIPLGVEQQIYTMSLMTIDLDNQREAAYLHQLAHGLRLSPSVCNQIHQRNGAPPIFEA